jgi:23S rRNA (cytosine1962-C5)-methyltransferase
LCEVYAHGGGLLGVGYYNEKSSIRARMLTFADVNFTAGDLRCRIERAISYRNSILSFNNTDSCSLVNSNEYGRQDAAPALKTDSCRLINSEGDFLPGLIVDRYGKGLCLQIGTAGMEAWRGEIIDILGSLLSPSFIYERSDTESRGREGLEGSEGLVYGDAVDDPLIITENGVKYRISLDAGQKTGFFLDQRGNRALVRRYGAGRHVCDCFSYSGGFAINAALGGAASVLAVDISADAGDRLSENAKLNGVSVDFTKADVFSYLREAGQSSRKIDLLVLDPPKFARHPGEVDKAARGYKDINLAAMRLLSPGGLLVTFSCSGAVDPYLFRQIVFSAAADSGRPAQVLRVLSAGEDHPVNIAHKEGDYLKGLALRLY